MHTIESVRGALQAAGVNPDAIMDRVAVSAALAKAGVDIAPLTLTMWDSKRFTGPKPPRVQSAGRKALYRAGDLLHWYLTDKAQCVDTYYQASRERAAAAA